jgi:hypothetical protein
MRLPAGCQAQARSLAAAQRSAMRYAACNRGGEGDDRRWRRSSVSVLVRTVVLFFGRPAPDAGASSDHFERIDASFAWCAKSLQRLPSLCIPQISISLDRAR